MVGLYSGHLHFRNDQDSYLAPLQLSLPNLSTKKLLTTPLNHKTGTTLDTPTN